MNSAWLNLYMRKKKHWFNSRVSKWFQYLYYYFLTYRPTLFTQSESSSEVFPLHWAIQFNNTKALKIRLNRFSWLTNNSHNLVGQMKLACITQRQWPITAQTCHWSLGRPIGLLLRLFFRSILVQQLPADRPSGVVVVQQFPAHVWLTDWLPDWLGLGPGSGMGAGSGVRETGHRDWDWDWDWYWEWDWDWAQASMKPGGCCRCFTPLC